MTKKTLPRQIRDTETVRAFHLLYEKCIPIAGSCAAAYGLAERIHKARTGSRFYKNVLSFRNSRRHYLDNIKNAKRL